MNKVINFNIADNKPTPLNTNEKIYFTNFNDLEIYISNHRAIKHPLFNYLKNCAQDGFTAKQYQIYRENYFFRTIYTIPSVALLVVSASLQGDMETLATAGQNLYEELGSGCSEHIHSLLMLSSHNLHGVKIFNLESVEFNDILNGPLILDATRFFVEIERKLYTTNNYSIILGAALAHEMAADPMLVEFFESLFLSYRKYYSDGEFKKISQYFLDHINGVEKEHAKNAALAAKRWAKNEKILNDIAEGSISFLNIQSQLWDALYEKLLEFEHEGEKIPIIPLCSLTKA